MNNKLLLKLVKKQDVSINQLHSQYIPKICPVHLWTDPGLTVESSPHTDLLINYEKNGRNMDLLLNTKYAKMFFFWNEIGYLDLGKKRNRKYVKKKYSASSIYMTSLN